MAVQYIGDNPLNGGISLGSAATSLVSVYGVTPIAQRTSTVLHSSLVSASSYVSVASNTAAILLELTNACLGFGIYKVV